MKEAKQRPADKPMPSSVCLPRVAFVSAGQSPRNDIMHEILELTGRELDVDEFGALDGLDEYELEMMQPGQDDQRIYTRLSNGASMVVATSPLDIRIANVCAKLDDQGYDLIVVLTTGLSSKFRTYTPLLHAQRVIDTWFDAISMTKCNLGVVHPLKKQGEVTSRRLGGLFKIQADVVLSDRTDRIEEATRGLKDCDIVFLSSVAYSGAMAKKIGSLVGRPVVTARNVLASAMRLHFGYLSRKQEHHLDDVEERLCSAVPGLTAREREIVMLAVQGLSNKEAGLKLGISHRTVEKHRASAMNKLGVSTISGLMRFALML